jgi:hypothetical protein
MATSKDKKADKQSTDFSFRSSIRNDVVPMANDTPENEPHIPFTLLITILVLCIVLVIALPVMGVMYMDMNNATIVANEEIRKMKELRIKILTEVQER